VAGSRNLGKLKQTASESEGRIIPQRCDVTNSDDVKALVMRAKEDFGALHIMVNNAGILRSALLVDTSEEMWDEVMATNVKGMFLGTKHAIPLIAESGGGSIINMGSTNCFSAEKMNTAYVTSKGAVLMLTKNAAAECAELNIRVNTICPGATDTPIIRDYFELQGSREEGEKWMASYQPMGGIIPPEQIAYAAVYLASDESRCMTGTSMLVDGGLLAHWDHI
jgi:dihydroanticapsin dehydrogenase